MNKVTWSRGSLIKDPRGSSAASFSYHLKKGYVGHAHVVEVDFRVDPREVLFQALRSVRHDLNFQEIQK